MRILRHKRPHVFLLSVLQSANSRLGAYCTHDVEDIGLPLLTDISQMGMKEEQKW